MNNTLFTPYYVLSTTYLLTQCELTLSAAHTVAKAPSLCYTLLHLRMNGPKVCHANTTNLLMLQKYSTKNIIEATFVLKKKKSMS